MHEAMLDGVTQAVMGLTAGGAIAYVNAQACSRLGKDRRALVGGNWKDLRLVSVRDGTRTTPFEAWAEKVADRDGVHVLRRARDRQTPSFTCRLVRIEGAEPVRYLFTFWRSSHLEMADHQMAEVLDQAADMIVCLDRRFDIRLFNTMAEAALGRARDDVLFKPFSSLLAPCSRAAFRRLMKSAADLRQSDPGRAIRTLMLARKDGSIFPAEVSASITTHNGRMRTTLVMRDVSAQRRRMACALSEIELLRIVLENMHEGIVVFGPDDRLITHNRRFAELFDIPEPHIRDRMPWADLIRLIAARGVYGPETPDHYLARAREEMENRFDYVDRELANGRWLSIRRRRLPGGGFVATYRDITRRRREQAKLAHAMAAVQRSAGMRSAILDVLASEIAIAVLDEAGVIVEHNAAWSAFAREHGLATCQGREGRSLTDALAAVRGPFAAHAPAIAREIGAVLDGRRGKYTLDYALELGASARFYVMDVAPMGIEAIRGAVVRVEDRTVAKLAALEVEESQRRLEAIVENSGDAIVTLNVDGEIEALNGTTMDIFGYDKATLVGEKVHRILPAFPFLRAGEGFDGTVPAKFHDEMPGVHRDGATVLVDLMMCRVPHKDGEGFVLNLRDMTEYRTMQEQLHQTSKLAVLGEMAAGMAHELNQPLSVMRMAADNALIRMERGKADPGYLADAFALVSDQAGKLGKTILNLRTFARRESDTDRSAFNPCYAADAACQLLRARLALDSISLDLHVPDFCRSVRGNAIALEQVLINLIGNAKDAILGHRAERAADGDYVRVTVADGGGECVRIAVEDSGGGIPRNDLPKIFNPFFTTKKVGEGTGLGLSISYGIVTNLGGTIAAANTREGARFEITLPALPPTAAAPPEQRTETAET